MLLVLRQVGDALLQGEELRQQIYGDRLRVQADLGGEFLLAVGVLVGEPDLVVGQDALPADTARELAQEWKRIGTRAAEQRDRHGRAIAFGREPLERVRNGEEALSRRLTPELLEVEA